MANENMIQKHEDNFLAKIAGETPIDDNPRNSTEFWLNEIAENLPGGGTTVIANPTLAGTEDALTGLQVGDTKYKVGEKLYKHNIVFSNKDFLAAVVGDYLVSLDFISNSPTPITNFTDLYAILKNKVINASGIKKLESNITFIAGVSFSFNQAYARGYDMTAWAVDSSLLDHATFFISDNVLAIN